MYRTAPKNKQSHNQTTRMHASTTKPTGGFFHIATLVKRLDLQQQQQQQDTNPTSAAPSASSVVGAAGGNGASSSSVVVCMHMYELSANKLTNKQTNRPQFSYIYTNNSHSPPAWQGRPARTCGSCRRTRGSASRSRPSTRC